MILYNGKTFETKILASISFLTKTHAVEWHMLLMQGASNEGASNEYLQHDFFLFLFRDIRDIFI